MKETLKNTIKAAVDEGGFLTNIDEWTVEVASALAAGEGMQGLSGDQLDILKSLRDYYRKHAFFPILRSICANVHQPRTCVTDKFSDPVVAWKIAGLPNPGEEVNTFRSWEPLGF